MNELPSHPEPTHTITPPASLLRVATGNGHLDETPNGPREATELRAVLSRRQSWRPSEASTEADDEGEQLRRYRLRLRRQVPRWYDPVRKFWKRQVSVSVDADKQRDYLALERTFLGYLRTSVALSMVGIIIAQLFRLQHAPNPDRTLGYFILGRPLAAIFISASIAVSLLGAFRYWRQQNAMVRGKVHAGGWEIITIMVGSIALMLMLFVLMLAADIHKES